MALHSAKSVQLIAFRTSLIVLLCSERNLLWDSKILKACFQASAVVEIGA
jgi:hypothetical protein